MYLCISSFKVRGSSSFHPLGVSLIFSILRFYPSFLFIIFSFGIGSVYLARSPVSSLFRFYRATSFDEIKLSSTTGRGNFERRPGRANGSRLSVCPSTKNYRKMEEELISIGNRTRDPNAARSRLPRSLTPRLLDSCDIHFQKDTTDGISPGQPFSRGIHRLLDGVVLTNLNFSKDGTNEKKYIRKILALVRVSPTSFALLRRLKIRNRIQKREERSNRWKRREIKRLPRQQKESLVRRGYSVGRFFYFQESQY